MFNPTPMIPAVQCGDDPLPRPYIILPHVNGNQLPDGTDNVPYSFQLRPGFNVSGTFTYNEAGPLGLPPGISGNGSGLLSGTPVTPGTYNFEAILTDDESQTATQPITIVILP